MAILWHAYNCSPVNFADTCLQNRRYGLSVKCCRYNSAWKKHITAAPVPRTLPIYMRLLLRTFRCNFTKDLEATIVKFFFHLARIICMQNTKDILFVGKQICQYLLKSCGTESDRGVNYASNQRRDSKMSVTCREGEASFIFLTSVRRRHRMDNGVSTY